MLLPRAPAKRRLRAEARPHPGSRTSAGFNKTCNADSKLLLLNCHIKSVALLVNNQLYCSGCVLLLHRIATQTGSMADEANVSPAPEDAASKLDPTKLLDQMIAQQKAKEAEKKEAARKAALERAKYPIWERSKDRERQKEQNLKDLQVEAAKRQLAGCTFTPTISRTGKMVSIVR